jgi:hypothetical protein
MNWKSHYGVPPEFRIRQSFPYPSDNKINFEEWFYDNYPYMPGETEREYLPIFFNGYLVTHKFGEDKAAVKRLQDFVDTLDRSKKYYCIHQFDLGPMVDFKDLDILCFGMSGGRIDYPLPLLCAPHNFKVGIQKSLFANFIGRNTHPIRQRLLRDFSGRSIYVSEAQHPLRDFCQILAKSTYTICPRGCGASSFRILEALEYGSIPVYLSDTHVQPHWIDFNEYGVLVKEEELPRLEQILHSISHAEIIKKQERGAEIFKEYYTFEKNREIILNKIAKPDPLAWLNY